jgi:8-oxo-dGTP pyrophosphatase MutT (NUDIX family)
MEICEVVDEFGARTGRVVPRGTELAADEFYLVVHIWIKDKAGDFLIQQRAGHLTVGPGIWATTVGYIQAGEDSLAGAVREVEEELGLPLSPVQFQRFRRQALENRVEDIWLVIVARDAVLPTPGPDVADWKWVSGEELAQLANRGDFFRYSYLDALLALRS